MSDFYLTDLENASAFIEKTERRKQKNLEDSYQHRNQKLPFERPPTQWSSNEDESLRISPFLRIGRLLVWIELTFQSQFLTSERLLRYSSSAYRKK